MRRARRRRARRWGQGWGEANALGGVRCQWQNHVSMWAVPLRGCSPLSTLARWGSVGRCTVLGGRHRPIACRKTEKGNGGGGWGCRVRRSWCVPVGLGFATGGEAGGDDN